MNTDHSAFLEVLHARFEANMHRHNGLQWNEVLDKIGSNTAILSILLKMEESGGEPDVVVFDDHKAEVLFADCAAESPKGRRSLCYDQEAFDKRKENKPKDSAARMAQQIGIEILDEAQYRKLQQLGSFDTKTSSWLRTPENIRKLGGAIFGDRRFDTVFTYHNGAESYYAARGFRGFIKI